MGFYNLIPYMYAVRLLVDGSPGGFELLLACSNPVLVCSEARHQKDTQTVMSQESFFNRELHVEMSRFCQVSDLTMGQ